MPLFVKLDGDLAEGIGENPDLAGIIRIVVSAILEYKPNITPELCYVIVDVQVEAILQCTEVHWLLDVLIVIRSSISYLINRLHEMHAIVNLLL